ncbi:LicD family protein [Nocardioides albertanoniae]|uniref:LicD family protein n=1 Tax=Nocardioides albertanoniae TaxID=1175486 RepID=A0A543A193_9ACTN|nr:LicD family protein [Nocardioides albertanoniae]TQL66345.1 LicD family protein [Nocardioides albertanoniae]
MTGKRSIGGALRSMLRRPAASQAANQAATQGSTEAATRPESLHVREPVRLRRLPGTPTMFPSLGWFGGIGAAYLSVPLAGPVSVLRVHVPEKVEGQVDLRGFELYSGGTVVPVRAADQEVEQSSAAPSQPKGTNAFEYGSLRTKKETGAWWSVRLATPVEADELRVYNRRDGWGNRSRRLTVAVGGPDGGFHTVWSLDSDRVVSRTLALVSRLLGREVGADVLESEDSARAAHAEVLADLARLAEKGLLTPDAEEQRLLTALIPLRLPADAALTDDEWTLAGHLLAAERLRFPTTATSMPTYQLVLGSTVELRRLETEVNRAAAVIGGEPAGLTRHGFRDHGVLRKRSAGYVETMRHATALLTELGKPALMAYGTLLGAVREGDFLAHDDDVDMLIPLEAATREEAEPLLAALRDEIAERGWKVARPNNQLNFHITDPETGLHIDLFPLLVDGDATTLHMEKMKLRPIATSLVLPASEISFHGTALLAPADPEGFLAERYGPTWGTPDPFYDWPWKLSDASD